MPAVQEPPMSSPAEPPALVPPRLIERCQAILRQRPAAVACDIDGTLSVIAATPGAAIITDDIRVSLARLASRLDVVAIVSGRSAPIASAATRRVSVGPPKRLRRFEPSAIA